MTATPDTPILVSRWGVAHRVVSAGRPACGSAEELVRGEGRQAQAHRLPPCVPCWGRRPW